MTTHRRSRTLKILAGVALFAVAFSLRGMGPELVRYLRIRRM